MDLGMRGSVCLLTPLLLLLLLLLCRHLPIEHWVPAKPTLIIIHGKNMPPSTAASVGRRMAPAYSVVAPAMPDLSDMTASVQALDAIVAGVAGPLVLAGFSAGAQLVQRYALSGNHRDRPTLFIVASASSYAYLTAARPVAVQDCTGVDDWKYGLADRPDIAAPISLAAFLTKPVLVMVGAADTDTAGADLDTSCRAAAQGVSHYARALAYISHVRSLGASAHSLQVVPGAAHDIHRVLGACTVLR